ncbi:MAG: oligosaccharide flippase family protein [Saprospiraceae bacterium]|nr:oligosaccharide flippase family protein [Saprospiraceae bacterium]
MMTGSEQPASPSILHQIRYTIQADGVQMILGFITSIILVRYLGPEGNGILTKLTYAGNLLLAFASFQFFRGVPYLYQQYGGLQVKQWLTLGIISTFLLGSLIVLLDAWTFHLFSWEHELIFNLLMVVYLMLALGQKCLDVFVQVRTAFRKLWLFQWLAATIKLGVAILLMVSFSFLFNHHRIYAGLTVALIGYIPLLLFAYLYFKPGIKLGLPSRKFLRNGFGYSGRMWGITLVSIVINNIPLWYIERKFDTATLGIYGLALTLSGLPFTFTLAYKKAILPFLLSHFKTDAAGCYRLIRLHNSTLMVIGVLGALAGHFLLPLVYGREFTQSAPLLVILLVWTAAIGLSTILQTIHEAENKLGQPLIYELVIAAGITLSLLAASPWTDLNRTAMIFSSWGILLAFLFLNGVRKQFHCSFTDLFLLSRQDIRYYRSVIKAS